MSGPKSLPEVHGSVTTAQVSLWKRMFAFAGPAYLVSVGYMDPGNWATDLEGGARFGYQLLWVLVMSNAMAVLLQTLSARLGIVNRRDLAQACRETYPRVVNGLLWFLCEIAIAACDLAEILGAAIGFNLLFKIPLLIGVLITATDTLFILWFSRFGIRIIEAIVLGLITVIAACFGVEIWLVKPGVAEVASGLIPRLTPESLYVAIGILGATVMPHNLYLHSALVQTRRIGKTYDEKRRACRYNFVDSVIALNGALLINAAILILAATAFFKRGIVVTQIAQAHLLLAPLLGTAMASVMFAVALLAAGQSSTLTGTMAGQIVMEGFLNFRMRPWLRRLITRLAAVVPAAVTIYISGEEGIYRLLILSQVVLSLQLPFAVIPLIHFTSDRRRMGMFSNRTWVKLLAWAAAAIIVALNARLVAGSIAEWLDHAREYRLLLTVVLVPLASGLGLLLVYVALEPWLPQWVRRLAQAPEKLEPAIGATTVKARYERILVPLDHTPVDRTAVGHAAGMALAHNARLRLLHIEEGVSSQVYGALAEDKEVETGEEYLDGILEALHAQGIEAEAVVRTGRKPAEDIVSVAREWKADLLVMGAHGHKGLSDMVFGTTINAVRHQLSVPLLIVRD
jgi:manganese transport protein